MSSGYGFWPMIAQSISSRLGSGGGQGLTQQTNDPVLSQILGMGGPQSTGGVDEVSRPMGIELPGMEASSAESPAGPTVVSEPRSWKSMSRDQKLELMNKLAEDAMLGFQAAADFNLQPAQSVHMGNSGGGVTLQSYQPPVLGLNALRG